MATDVMWFQGWSDLVRVLLVGSAAYATLVLVLRVSGKRTLAKLNAFDLVVTVALGSTLATIVLNSSVSWAEGAVALAMLALLQLLVALTTSRVPAVRQAVTSKPSYLLRDGVLREDAMRDQRVAEAEVRQALRSSGTGSLRDVAAVVLETDGTLSVITKSQLGDGWALGDVPEPVASPMAPGDAQGD
jgi:uncharacterized membrane protein YcaP (DUF421 family)